MKDKFILDACCGPRHFWFNKTNPNVLFMDIRKEPKGFIAARPNREVNPDIIADFRKMPFKDKSFKLVIFDPPHLKAKKMTGTLMQSYGVLNKDTWKEDIKQGFKECYRVLENYGVLIFKWNGTSISFKEVLELFPIQPLIGQRGAANGSKVVTKWFCFMKIPEEQK